MKGKFKLNNLHMMILKLYNDVFHLDIFFLNVLKLYLHIFSFERKRKIKYLNPLHKHKNNNYLQQ